MNGVVFRFVRFGVLSLRPLPCDRSYVTLYPRRRRLALPPAARRQTRGFVPFWPFSVDSAAGRVASSRRDEAWNAAVSDAERLVGYPTSFMSLRLLLSDEVSNVAMQLRKLVGTKHPLLGTAKALLYDEKRSVQMRGLIVLLLAKTIGTPRREDVAEMSEAALAATAGASVSGIHASQRTIAELVEAIYMADLIHCGLLDHRDLTELQESMATDIAFANRMAVLAGDYLLANACTGLARLGSTRVVELVADAIGNLMEARFILDGTERDWGASRSASGENQIRAASLRIVVSDDAASAEGYDAVNLTRHNWEKKTFLGVASLLAKACEAALVVVGHDAQVQTDAREFAVNFVYAQQVKADVEQFTRQSKTSAPRKEDGAALRILSAPAVLHAEAEGVEGLARRSGGGGIVLGSVEGFVEAVNRGPGVEMAKEMCARYLEEALERLDRFPAGESRTALKNIVNSMAVLR